jgi:hypothetical protein
MSPVSAIDWSDAHRNDSSVKELSVHKGGHVATQSVIQIQCQCGYAAQIRAGQQLAFEAYGLSVHAEGGTPFNGEPDSAGWSGLTGGAGRGVRLLF